MPRNTIRRVPGSNRSSSESNRSPPNGWTLRLSRPRASPAPARKPPITPSNRLIVPHHRPAPPRASSPPGPQPARARHLPIDRAKSRCYGTGTAPPGAPRGSCCRSALAWLPPQRQMKAPPPTGAIGGVAWPSTAPPSQQLADGAAGGRADAHARRAADRALPRAEASADAYAVQLARSGQEAAGGARVVGKKIGLTSLAMQRMLNVDQPDYGHLLDTMTSSKAAEMPDRRADPDASRARDRLRPEGRPDRPQRHSRAGAGGHGVTSRRPWRSSTAACATGRSSSGDTVADNGSSARVVLGTTSSSARRVSTSRSFVGSSSRRTLPPLRRSLARCTRFRSPPERSPTRFCWSPPLKLNHDTYCREFTSRLPSTMVS